MNEDRVPHLQLVTTIERTLPALLHMRARVPGQGHPDPGRARPASSRRAASAAATASPCAARTPSRCSAASRTPQATCSRRASPVAAILAPSYPAEFTETDDAPAWSTALRELGFASRARGGVRRRPRGRASTRSLLAATATAATSPPPARPWSATCASTTPTCWTVLAPIVSPMIAMARVLHDPARARRSRSCSSGPASPRRARCATSSSTARSHAALTYTELRAMLGGAQPAPAAARRRATASSTRRTAAWAPSSPSPAACCRRPT